MAVLIDPARWPAHGTRFAHLVSDASLDELHAFAAAAGIPLRAFDHDHYDVAEDRHPQLVALGAVPVPEQELLRRLRDAGLRVRPRDRTPSAAAVLPVLRAAWDGLLPRAPSVGTELLERWSEPHRVYHDVRHLAHALTAAREISGDEVARPVQLALWFHDAVYRREPGADEEASARLVGELLAGTGLPSAEVDEVARLVRLTADHVLADPADAAGAIVLDADLAVLGLPRGRYDVYVRDVRLEYGQLSEAAFRRGRLDVLDHLLGLDPLFATRYGRLRWQEAARRNLAAERRRWLTEPANPLAKP